MGSINKLLSDEARITSDYQSKVKTMLVNSIKEVGLDKDLIKADMEPKLVLLTRKTIRGYLQLGMNWLKG